MKLVFKAALVSMVCGLIASGSALAAEKTKGATAATCAWSDVAKMKEHFSKHVTYPTTGAQIKETVKGNAGSSRCRANSASMARSRIRRHIRMRQVFWRSM
jgi:hypothetical protein